MSLVHSSSLGLKAWELKFINLKGDTDDYVDDNIQLFSPRST